MYKIPYITQTSRLEVNQSQEGETLERKLRRMMTNKEPIKDPNAKLIYTERKEGVRASTNIRTDRFEIAIGGTDKIAKSYQARREERHTDKKKETTDGKPESIQGKPETDTNKA